MIRMRSRFVAVAYPAVPVLVGLGIWELIVAVRDVPVYLLPAPSRIAQVFFKKFGILADHSIVTLQEVLIGYAASVVLGVLLAVMIVQWRPFERSVYPLLVTSQTVPKMALAPLFVVWFGFGLVPKVLVVFLIAFFPIVIDSVVGLRTVQPEMLSLAASMGANKIQILRQFRLPSALPSIFAGMKVAITLSVVGAVVGEFIAGDRGLGYLIQLSAYNFQVPLLFGAILMLVAMGMVLFLIIQVAELVFVPWNTEKVGRQRAIGA